MCKHEYMMPGQSDADYFRAFVKLAANIRLSPATL
jgi:hypothetical protein